MVLRNTYDYANVYLQISLKRCFNVTDLTNFRLESKRIDDYTDYTILYFIGIRYTSMKQILISALYKDTQEK